MDKPIYAENKLYFFLRPYVDLCCRDSYTFFGARTDVFKKPQIAKIIKFLKILKKCPSLYNDILTNFIPNESK